MAALVTTLFTSNVLAFTPPEPPANGRHIVDQAGKLKPDQFDALEKRIETMNSSTKNEFGVLILSTMDGNNIEDVANATYKKWGVGKRGLDNGVLLVISVAERKSRLETGKGVGGDLPDLKCNDILKNNLAPHLKKGDFYGGIDSTLGAVGSQLESRASQKADPKPQSQPQASCSASAPGSSTNALWFLLVVGGGIGGILYARARARRKEEEHRLQEIAARRRREEERARIALEEKAFAERRAQERETRMQRISTPPVPVPEVVRKPTVPRPTPKATSKVATTTTTVSSAVLAAEAAEAANRARRMREEREAEERRARQRREEEDRSRRQREEEDRRSSYSSSSSSSFDWGGSSGGSDSGSGFGGGDSGGGGSSGDW